MPNDPLVLIKHLNKMSKHLGKDVASNMGIPISEFKEYIKPSEIKSIVKQYCVKKNGKYLMNSIILQKIFREINNWVLGIQLAKMASDGQLEARWDEEQNCIMFETRGK